MSTYELDDEMVRAWLQGHPDGNFSSALREQLPLPVPIKVGAIVKATYTNGVYVRWTSDNLNGAPWIDTTDGEHLTSERLGRITEILSEGKELDL